MKSWEETEKEVNYRESKKDVCSECIYLTDTGVDHYYCCDEVFGTNLSMFVVDKYTCDKFKKVKT